MIRCECGEPIVEAVDRRTVVVDGEAIPFARTTDWVACPNCGRMRSTISLRAEAVASGELVPPGDEPAADTPSALEAAAAEALAAIREMSGGAGAAWDDAYADIVLSALSDISREDEGEPSPT